MSHSSSTKARRKRQRIKRLLEVETKKAKRQAKLALKGPAVKKPKKPRVKKEKVVAEKPEQTKPPKKEPKKEKGGAGAADKAAT